MSVTPPQGEVDAGGQRRSGFAWRSVLDTPKCDFRSCETLAIGGPVLGLVGAYALGRTMQSMLFGTGALSLPWSSSLDDLRNQLIRRTA